MEKKVKFAKFIEPEKVEEIAREVSVPITPLLRSIGGEIFKILDEGNSTVTISVDSEPREIDRVFISEILMYDKNGVVSALKLLKKVCKCHTTINGGCEDTCPFYGGEIDGSEKCKLVDPPADWVIVDEEIWRPIR